MNNFTTCKLKVIYNVKKYTIQQHFEGCQTIRDYLMKISIGTIYSK